MSTIALKVDSHILRVTKPDRVLWPRLGLTKAWLLDYYRSVADVLLPHVRGHPVTLHRFPQGIDEAHWYQTRAPSHPDWVHTVTFRPTRTGKVFDVVVIDDLPSLLWAAQIGGIELHPYLGTVGALDRPTAMVFDLDPGAPAGLLDSAVVAQFLREVLEDAGLSSFPKTSGQKGIHVVVPLDGAETYETSKPFARAVAQLLAREHPLVITDTMSRQQRGGKVFIDWSQNDAGKSTVAPYSLRGLPVPTASVPVRWAEIDRVVTEGDARSLWHTAADVLERIASFGDVHADVLTTPQRLPGW